MSVTEAFSRSSLRAFGIIFTLGCLGVASAQNLASSPSLPDSPGTASMSSNEDISSSDESFTVKKLPQRFLNDEWQILSSPTRTEKSDMKWLLPLAGTSALAFATDTHTMRHVVSSDPDFNSANGTASDAIRDAAIGIPAIMFIMGYRKEDDRLRETGLLSGEAMLDAYALSTAVKYIALRERPEINNARGHFWSGDASSDPSFVSGHAVVTWSSAAVMAGEYSKPWQQVAIYSFSTGLSVTRVLSQQHFPSDVLLGSAAGWLIGHYIYRAHHKQHSK